MCVYRTARKSTVKRGFPTGEAARVLKMVRKAAHHNHQVRKLKAQQLVPLTNLGGLATLNLFNADHFFLKGWSSATKGVHEHWLHPKQLVR